MRKDAYYFSHDSNARHDEKILAMRSVYKSEGYGWYWVIIEMLRDANAHRLRCKGKYWHIALAQEMQTQPEIALAFMNDCINEFHLFETDGTYIWSESLQRRMMQKAAASEVARKKAMKRWGARQKPEPVGEIAIHQKFAGHLMADEGLAEREAIEKQTGTTLSGEVLNEFMQHLSTIAKQHEQSADFNSHLRNWLNKRPKPRMVLAKKKVV